MSTTPPDMKIRLSAELRRQVETAAKANNRTLNSEIVSRLEASFRDGDKVHSASIPTSQDMEERVKAAVSTGLRAISDEDIQYLAGRVASIFSRK